MLQKFSYVTGIHRDSPRDESRWEKISKKKERLKMSAIKNEGYETPGRVVEPGAEFWMEGLLPKELTRQISLESLACRKDLDSP